MAIPAIETHAGIAFWICLLLGIVVFVTLAYASVLYFLKWRRARKGIVDMENGHKMVTGLVVSDESTQRESVVEINRNRNINARDGEMERGTKVGESREFYSPRSENPSPPVNAGRPVAEFYSPATGRRH